MSDIILVTLCSTKVGLEHTASPQHQNNIWSAQQCDQIHI